MLRIEFLMFIIARYWKVLSITAVLFIWGMIGTQPNANVSLGSGLILSPCVLFRSTQWDKDNRCFNHREVDGSNHHILKFKNCKKKVQKLGKKIKKICFQKFLLNHCSKSHIAFKAMLPCQPTSSWKVVTGNLSPSLPQVFGGICSTKLFVWVPNSSRGF